MQSTSPDNVAGLLSGPDGVGSKMRGRTAGQKSEFSLPHVWAFEMLQNAVGNNALYERGTN